MVKQEPPKTGKCYCGCGEPAERYFAPPGHDQIARLHVIAREYGSTAAFLLAHGYGPDGKKANPW